MDIIKFEGMNLLSLEWNEVRFDLKAMNGSGEVFQAVLSNPGQAPIDVKVHWLNMRMVYDADLEAPSFGELETIGTEDGVIHIEADAGFFSVAAARIFVQQLTGLKGNED